MEDRDDERPPKVITTNLKVGFVIIVLIFGFFARSHLRAQESREIKIRYPEQNKVILRGEAVEAAAECADDNKLLSSKQDSLVANKRSYLAKNPLKKSGLLQVIPSDTPVDEKQSIANINDAKPIILQKSTKTNQMPKAQDGVEEITFSEQDMERALNSDDKNLDVLLTIIARLESELRMANNKVDLLQRELIKLKSSRKQDDSSVSTNFSKTKPKKPTIL